MFKRLSLFAAAVLGMAAFSCGLPVRAQGPPPSVPESVQVQTVLDTDSAKIQVLNPCAAWQDYRVRRLNTATPFDYADSRVKYFGQVHITAGWSGWSLAFVRDGGGSLVYPLQTTAAPAGSGGTGELVTVPAWEADQNALTKPGWYIVEALDSQGPFPPGSAYDYDNNPLQACTDGMCVVGSDAGGTLDGLFSINGQGPSTNTPAVVAMSQPFYLDPSAAPPHLLDPSQHTSVFDNFSAAAQQVETPNRGVNPETGNETFTITSMVPWQVLAQGVDTAHTTEMVEDDHEMDVLFDGGGPGSSIPPHNNHAALAISPVPTTEFGKGHILHVTFEVDGHQDSRRWTGVAIYPYNADPATVSFVETDGQEILNSLRPASGKKSDPDTPLNQGLLIQTPGPIVNVNELCGIDAGGKGIETVDQNYERPLLFGPSLTPALSSPTGYHPTALGQQYNMSGRGLDDRTRFDCFVSYSHLQVYEDGCKVCDTDLPQPLGFTRAKIYFVHYLYHTGNEINDCKSFTPWETFWIGDVPYSDERHWGDLGSEVLPNSPAQWAATGLICQYPAPVLALPPGQSASATFTTKPMANITFNTKPKGRALKPVLN